MGCRLHGRHGQRPRIPYPRKGGEMRTARPLSQGQRERLLRSPSARSGRGGRSPGPPGWPRRAGRGPPGTRWMELRENILSYIVIGGLCADDGIKDGDGWVDASCCARIDDGFHPAAVNEDLGSDGRIDLADTTVQSGGRNAGDPSLVDREHGLTARARHLRRTGFRFWGARPIPPLCRAAAVMGVL